jgi:DNA-binding transcriptional LysR family regulator
VVSLDDLLAAGGLAAPDVDAAVGLSLTAPRDARAQTLYVEDVVLAVRRGHPLARSPITAARLSAAAWVDTLVLLGGEGVGHGVASKALAEHGVTRRIALAVPTFTLAALTAARTDLVAGLPRRVGEALAADLVLEALELPFPLPGMPIALMWHERTHADEGARYFRALITEAARGAVRERRRKERAR